MSEGFEKLPGRALVRISGEDSEHFLENLVTCRIEGLAAGDAAFGGLLSPQGKVLFDFFVVATGGAYLFDLDQSLAEEFIKRMRFYKLRAKVEIEPVTGNEGVVAGWGSPPEGLDGITITDPRLPEMGWRTYGDNPAIEAGSQYRAHRIETGMPAGGEDFEYGDGFPHDCLMDQFGGVDFKKGCYVGQEVVSRMQHRGTARKRIVKVSAENALPETGTALTVSDKPVGTLGTVHENKGLAMVRLDRVARARAENVPVMAEEVEVKLALPDWVRFSWPEAAAS